MPEAPRRLLGLAAFWKHYLVALALALATAASCAAALDKSGPKQTTTLYHVWWYGWLTAISTGLGALPLVFLNSVQTKLVGIANAIATGMMTAASGALLFEGFEVNLPTHSPLTSPQGTVLGSLVGLLAMLASQHLLQGADDHKLAVLNGINLRKGLLIIMVMTIHSFSEGIGIGVACGADAENSVRQVGKIVTATLAVHNVPEGFAVSVVLVSQGMSVIGAALWSIFTSIPQPIMALASFVFVDTFTLVQPTGLGFAAGAMLSVAWLELFVEAREANGFATAGGIAAVSAAIMWRAHELLE